MQTNGDVLGDEGRKALDACVKVKIYGRPENIQKYHWRKAFDRLRECCNDNRNCQYSLNTYETQKYQYFLLPKIFDENGKPDEKSLYNIIEIHDALCKFDEVPFVEKYPPTEASQTAGELRQLIDRRRAAIERECQEAVKNPDGKEQYSWLVAQRRVRDCFAGNFVGDRMLLKYKRRYDRNNPDMFTIFDIHDAVGFWDEALVLGMIGLTKNDDYYSVERLNSYKKQKEDIEQELNEARFAGDNNIAKEFSRDDAKERVKAYFPKFFYFFRAAADKHVDVLLPIKYDHNGVVSESYNIFDINKAVQHLDQKKCLQKYPEDEGPGTDELRKSIEEHSSSVEEEYKKAKSGLRRYSPDEAEKRIRGCFKNALSKEDVKFPANGKERIEVFQCCPTKFNIKVTIKAFNQTYDILDIHKVFCLLQEKLDHWYPHESVKANMDGVIKEYQQAITSLRQYSWDEAEGRVRGCFAGALLEDTDIFPHKEAESGIPKTKQTYDIFEIKRAVDHFDVKPRFDKHKIVHDNDSADSKDWNNKADEARVHLEEEYLEATKSVEIDHGSGFVIHNHFIITNKHVIEDVFLQDKQREVYVSNSVIGELHCEVIHHDVSKDLALLYCPELNLSNNQISPLQLSTQSLLPGMQIFAFGFPMSHTGERALFVTGHVSGSKTTYSGPTLAVLNCSLNSGNSGGPILCWDKGQLKVVGVATQKHFKEILTLEERQKIEEIRESLETSTICSVPDDDIKDAFRRELSLIPLGPSWDFQLEPQLEPQRYRYEFHSQPEPEPRQIPMYILTLKLYDALETHSQFNLSNALPGCYVVEFIKECISKHSGEGKEELTDVVQQSEDLRARLRNVLLVKTKSFKL